MRPKVFGGACLALCLVLLTSSLLAAPKGNQGQEDPVTLERADLIDQLDNPRIEGLAAIAKAEARLSHAQGLLAAGEVDAAVRQLNYITSTELPSDPMADKVLSSAYMELGGVYLDSHLSKASNYFGQAIEGMTDNTVIAETIRRVASAHARAGNTSEAERLEGIARNIEAGIIADSLGWVPQVNPTRDPGAETCDLSVPFTIPHSEVLSVSVPYEENWREFTTTETLQVRLETLGTPTSVGTDTQLYLYGDCADYPFGYIDWDDDGGPGLYSLLELTLDAGTYYVRIQGYSSSTPQDFEFAVTATVPPEPDDYEPDNEASQATLIGFRNNGVGEGGQLGRDKKNVQDHSIFPALDVDYLTFGLARANNVRIETMGDTDTLVGVLNAGGALFAVDDDSGDGFNSKIEACWPAGDWLVAVLGSFTSTIGEYSIAVDVESPCTFEDEPNGVCGQANDIVPGELMNGLIAAAGTYEVDYFTFTLDEEANVVIETNGYDEFDVDSYLELYNGCPGDLLLADDDGGAGFLSRIEAVLPAGTYFFNVQASPIWDQGDSWPYSVMVTLSEPPLAEMEPNDDCSIGNPVLIGDSLQASINPAGDYDYYLLTLDEDSDVEVETSGPSGDTVLAVFDAAGTELIGCDEDSGDGLFSMWRCGLPAGTYCVGVKDYGFPSVISLYNIEFRSYGPTTPSEPLECPITDPYGQCDPY